MKHGDFVARGHSSVALDGYTFVCQLGQLCLCASSPSTGQVLMLIE